MNTVQTNSIILPAVTKLSADSIAHVNIHIPVFAIIVCPFLAYEFLFNLMPYALDFSSILGSIIFTISLLFLTVPLFEVVFFLRSNGEFFFHLHPQKKSFILNYKDQVG